MDENDLMGAVDNQTTFRAVNLPPLQHTPQAMVSELKRELQMRRAVYSTLTAKRDFDQLMHQFDVLREVLEVIEAVFVDELRPAQGAFLG